MSSTGFHVNNSDDIHLDSKENRAYISCSLFANILM